MNATLSEATALTQALVKALGSQREVDLVLCPPFTALAKVGDLIRSSRISLGAQDLHWEAKGAYTGEISPLMLKDLGCRYCIIGHSERRQLMGETDPAVHRKLLAALQHGLTAILCVGETLETRQNGKTWSFVEGQLEKALEGVEPKQMATQVVIAYEPIWAIGTGHNATPAQAQEIQGAIRSWLAKRIGAALAQTLRIQYGGSVKPENAAEFMIQPDVDGALVGGASLDPKAFVSIVEAATQAKGTRCSTA